MMSSDRRDLLSVLQCELQFLEKGGYRLTARAAWRPQFLFQDSPTCLNFDPTQPRKPCTDCVLMRLVPKDYQAEEIPCRYIPLNEKGETVDSFYRYGTQQELEAAAKKWLRAAIRRLEDEKSGNSRLTVIPEIHVRARTTRAA